MHVALQTNAVKHKQKLGVLYLGVVCHSWHADDLNTCHLICLSHMCDPHRPKQNGAYCWFYQIQTGLNCNFTHYNYKITQQFHTLRNDLNHANTKEF